MGRGKSAIESQIRMINLAKEIIESASKDLPQLTEVYVFGSRARGDYLDTSDIDLLFVFKGIKDVPTFDRMYMVSKYIKGNVDYVVLDEEEKDKIKEKKLLWKREIGFVDLKEFLA
ncbi:nucleotidyltransferase domain-containing protein [Acidianus sp. HS-5]|uniref:nucleotidyltransferase domain-containing protein n=1 Tax=Acidianus sp. HS-5 TaxID=2886040 RepID=UPI001F1DE589|nr:nucleotidyltransferase domain-containing protein [Acidianus sp. HS-5]BDC17857.1 DNA polymerase subunit beta [Acidianus sp. HS-5]